MSTLRSDNRGIVVRCPACGKSNRVPYERLGETGQCGHCGASLPPPDGPVDIASAEQFDRLVAASPLPVVVDFWAPWCGPCRMVAPELAKVAASEAGRVVVVKVNTEALPEIGLRYTVQSIPTMAVFSGGRLAGRTTGARPAAAIQSFIRDSLGAVR